MHHFVVIYLYSFSFSLLLGTAADVRPHVASYSSDVICIRFRKVKAWLFGTWCK